MGVASIFSIPNSVYITIAIILALAILILYFLFRLQKKNWFIWFIIIILILTSIIMILAIVGALTGQAYNWFKIIIRPIGWLVPLGDWEGRINNAIIDMQNFYRTGQLNVPEPSGFTAINDASKTQGYVRIILLIIFGLYLTFIIWRKMFRKKKK